MPAKPLRMALGSLLIQKQHGYSDNLVAVKNSFIVNFGTDLFKFLLVFCISYSDKEIFPLSETISLPNEMPF